MVVVIEPGRKGIGAFVVGGEGLSVGPLGLEGAVEPLYLSVGPWTVRFDEPLLGADGGDSVLERGGPPVGHGVVGQDSLDVPDAMGGEVAAGPDQECRCGGTFSSGRTSA